MKRTKFLAVTLAAIFTLTCHLAGEVYQIEAERLERFSPRIKSQLNILFQNEENAWIEIKSADLTEEISDLTPITVNAHTPVGDFAPLSERAIPVNKVQAKGNQGINGFDMMQKSVVCEDAYIAYIERDVSNREAGFRILDQKG
ncbi:MAG TPA: hypothetical protein ENN84_12215, partial [Candidatus Marinimicrobia bacterium]|nr:hypothetical protein [Candidatus Neomarinimicrobiota bacterium]